MKVIEDGQDSVFLEYQGVRYMLETRNWRLKKSFAGVSYLNSAKRLIEANPDATEMYDTFFKLIRLGPAS